MEPARKVGNWRGRGRGDAANTAGDLTAAARARDRRKEPESGAASGGVTNRGDREAGGGGKLGSEAGEPATE